MGEVVATPFAFSPDEDAENSRAAARSLLEHAAHLADRDMEGFALVAITKRSGFWMHACTPNGVIKKYALLGALEDLKQSLLIEIGRPVVDEEELL